MPVGTTRPQRTTTMTRESLLNSTLFEFYATSVSDNSQVDKLIGTSSYLLKELNNPHNIEVLVCNLNASPAIWSNPDILFTSKRLLECYLVAARGVLKNKKETEESDDGYTIPKMPRLRLNTWLSAVERGISLHNGESLQKPISQRNEWKSSLVFAGIAYGISMDKRKDSSPYLEPEAQALVDRLSLRTVELANVVISHPAKYPPVAISACIIALAVIPLQFIHIHLPIRIEFALPILDAMLGPDGLLEGEAFIPPGDAYITPDGLINWSSDSAGFIAWKNLWNRPILSLLSQLLWLEVELAKHAPSADLDQFVEAINRLNRFSMAVCTHWERSAFADVELTQAGRFLTPDTFEGPWKLLDSQLSKLAVAVVAPLKEIIGRLLAHGVFTPGLARICIHTLHNISFATQGRITSSSFYNFALAASVDVLSLSPESCNQVFRELAPPKTLPLPRRDRVKALFFFNVAEALGSRLPYGIQTELIAEPALFYVTRSAGIHLHNPACQSSGLELWESAHVAILSLVGNTHLSPLDMVGPYLETLLENYPVLINLNQLIVGFKTLVQVASPPYALSTSFPDLPAILMEMLHQRALLSPKALPGYLLAMVEALGFMPHGALAEWLDTTYQLLSRVQDQNQFRTLDAAFRNTLSKMDPTRSIICCEWWTTKSSSRKNMLGQLNEADLTMSGALGEPSHL